MPMTYAIDREARLIRLVGSGRLTDDEMVQCITDLRADPQLEPDMNTLSDMRNIEMGFTAQGVSFMVDVMESTADRRAGARAAIVVDSDVAFGMSRMVGMLSDERVDPSFRSFRDMEAACEWLGVE